MGDRVLARGADAAAGRERHFFPRKSRASWLIASLLGLLALLMALALLGILGDRNKPVDGALVAVVLGILLACVAGIWYSVRRATRHRALLSIGPKAVSGSGLREPLPWYRLEDVELVQVMGQAFLDFKLRAELKGTPRRGLWGRQAARRRVNLASLTPDDQFAAYAAIHARLAPLREAAGLGAAPSVQQAHEATAFERQLDAATPTPWALYLVMLLNIGVWLLNVFQGISVMQPAPAELFAWGANSAAAVTLEGQYWRLLTATFLHAGLIHLALNMVGLWEAGRQICRWFGPGQFLLIYLGAALVGSGLSLHFSSQQSVSVGASGAVFGVLGAVLIAIWRHRERIPASIAKRLMSSQGVFVAYALLQGFTKPGIDNAAHVGGLLAGSVITLMLAPQMGQAPAAGSGRVQRQGLALGATGLAVFLLVLTTPAPQVHHRQLFETQATLQGLLPQLQAGEQALQRDAQEMKAGRLGPEQFVERVQTTHLPGYRRLSQTLMPLQLSAGHPLQALLVDMQAVHRLTQELLALQVRQFELAQAMTRQPQEPAGTQELADLLPQLTEKSQQLVQARQKLEATGAALKTASTRR